jgi:ATP synthase protein I
LSGPTPDPAAAVWRGGAGPAGLAAVLLMAGCALGGWRGASGSAVGSGLVLLGFSVGPLLMKLLRTASPPAVMAGAVAGYMIIILVLGLALAVLGDVAWLSGWAVGVTLIGCSAAWTLGQLRAVARLRVLAYGNQDPGTAGQGAPTGNGSPASPRKSAH